SARRRGSARRGTTSPAADIRSWCVSRSTPGSCSRTCSPRSTSSRPRRRATETSRQGRRVMSALHRRGFLGLSGAAALFAAGCTGSVGGGAGQPQAPSNTLRLFTYEGDETIDRFKGRIAEFDAEAGLTTTVDSLPGSGAAVYPDKLRTEVLGGKGPDVWRIWGGEIGRPFVTAKQAADLAPYYDRLGWNDRIDGNAVAGMTFDGVKAGVPLNAAALGAFYNRELLQKAKIDSDPQSYAELEEFNEKLVAAGITPAGLGGKYGWHIMRLFEYLLEHTAGPELHDQLLTGAASWDT